MRRTDNVQPVIDSIGRMKTRLERLSRRAREEKRIPEKTRRKIRNDCRRLQDELVRAETELRTASSIDERRRLKQRVFDLMGQAVRLLRIVIKAFGLS